jgi:hypothetical protein
MQPTSKIVLMNSYLKVIDETLRLVNISFVSFRQATKDVCVNGAIQKPHMYSFQSARSFVPE